jgi:hypothetical protein
MTWNMVVRGLNGTPPDLLDQFSNVFDGLLHAESQSEIAIDHIELFKEIALFGTIPEQV